MDHAARSRAACGGHAPLDLRVFGYTPDEARAYLEALDATGRAAYLIQMRALDTVFPPVLAGLLGLMLLSLTAGFYQWSRVVLLVPIGGYVVMDLCENALVAHLLNAGPAGFDVATARLASEFTVTKWMLLTASALLVSGVFLREKLRA